MLLVGFGWGKPVPVNPDAPAQRPRDRPGDGRGAGPLSNLLLAVVASLPIHLGMAAWHSPFLIVRTGGWEPGRLRSACSWRRW